MRIRKMKHAYWGEVSESWAGFSSITQFSHPFFNENASREIFLGDEFNENGDEIEDLPLENQLDEYSKTYQAFLFNIEDHLQSIQNKAFERYQKLYAHYYENAEKSGQSPLNITDVNAHNSYIQTMLHLRVSTPNTIRILIHYDLDTEHGLEFKLENNELIQVGGIAET